MRVVGGGELVVSIFTSDSGCQCHVLCRILYPEGRISVICSWPSNPVSRSFFGSVKECAKYKFTHIGTKG